MTNCMQLSLAYESPRKSRRKATDVAGSPGPARRKLVGYFKSIDEVIAIFESASTKRKLLPSLEGGRRGSKGGHPKAAQRLSVSAHNEQPPQAATMGFLTPGTEPVSRISGASNPHLGNAPGGEAPSACANLEFFVGDRLAKCSRATSTRCKRRRSRNSGA